MSLNGQFILSLDRIFSQFGTLLVEIIPRALEALGEAIFQCLQEEVRLLSEQGPSDLVSLRSLPVRGRVSLLWGERQGVVAPGSFSRSSPRSSSKSFFLQIRHIVWLPLKVWVSFPSLLEAVSLWIAARLRVATRREGSVNLVYTLSLIELLIDLSITILVT